MAGSLKEVRETEDSVNQYIAERLANNAAIALIEYHMGRENVCNDVESGFERLYRASRIKGNT